MTMASVRKSKNDAPMSMLPIVLTRAYRSLVDFLLGGLAFQGISPPDFAILEALLHKGPLSASSIDSRVPHMPNAPMRPALERLRRQGLIRTQRKKVASAKEIYELTEDGRRRITRIYRAHEKDIDAAIGILTRREQRALWRSLRTIAGNSDRIRQLRAGNGNGGLAPWQVRKVTDYMTSHVAEPVRLDQLAAQTGLSTSRFGRAFKASTGISPHRWQMNLRIQKAQELLREGGSSLAEISLATGFTGQSHFSRVFKDVVGVPPGAWQREHRF